MDVQRLPHKRFRPATCKKRPFEPVTSLVEGVDKDLTCLMTYTELGTIKNEGVEGVEMNVKK